MIATIIASCGYGLLLMLSAIFFFIKLAKDKDNVSWIVLCIVALAGVFFVGLFFIIEFIFLLIADPFMGKYWLDGEGIYFQTISKTIYYAWNEIVDVGITCWQADGSGRDSIFYIYFSKQPISRENRKWIIKYRSFKKPKKTNLPLYIKDYICIQYSKRDFNDLISAMPCWIKDKLMSEETIIALHGAEKLLNR